MAMSSSPLARTPLHHWHVAHAARLVTSDGWQVPEVYANPEQEIVVAQEGVALADISAFAKISLLGQGVPALTASLVGDGQALPPRGVARLEAGGGALACRLTADHLLLLATSTRPDVLDKRSASLLQQLPIIERNVTSAYAGFYVVGPHVGDVLRRLTFLDVSPAAMSPGTCAEAALEGIQALLVCPPRSALCAVQVYVGWDLGEFVWEELLKTGEQYRIAPIGLEAWRRVVHKEP